MNDKGGFVERARKLLFPTKEERAFLAGDMRTFFSECGKLGKKKQMENRQARKQKEAQERAELEKEATENPERGEWHSARKRERRLTNKEVELKELELLLAHLDKHPEQLDKVLSAVPKALSSALRKEEPSALNPRSPDGRLLGCAPQTPEAGSPRFRGPESLR